jgi:hypothetical protein
MMRAGIKPSLRAVSQSRETQRGAGTCGKIACSRAGRVTWTRRGAAGRPRFFRPAHGAAAQAAGVMGARERMGTKTTGLPDLLVFLGVWYTVATDRAAAGRLCTEASS